MKTYDVVALGELLIDFAPKYVNDAGYPTLSANPGGSAGQFSGGAEQVRLQNRHDR